MADPGAPPEGRRERNKREVRRRIVDECGRLFRKHGFDETTIDDIIDASGISRQTFFNYFPGKDAVLAELGVEFLSRQAAGTRRGLRSAGAEGIFEGIRRTIRGQLRAIEKDRDFMRLVFTRSGLFFPQGEHVGTDADEARLDRTRDFFHGLAALMRHGQQTGQIREDLPPEQAAEIYVSVLVITIRLWLTEYWPKPGSLVRRGMRALEVLERGLRAHEAQEPLPGAQEDDA